MHTIHLLLWILFQKHGFSPKSILPHGSYLMNCGSPNPETLKKSRDALLEELMRCEALGITLYNFHPGLCVCARMCVWEREGVNMWLGMHVFSTKYLTLWSVLFWAHTFAIRWPSCFSMCQCVGMMCKEYSIFNVHIFYILFLRFLCIHFGDLVKHGVLTRVSKILHYRNNHYHYVWTWTPVCPCACVVIFLPYMCNLWILIVHCVWLWQAPHVVRSV